MSESITDIVREMRERFKPYAKSESNDARYTAYMGYAEFADRIEAAHNHEVVVSKNATTTQESLAVGNNANMRDDTRVSVVDAAREIKCSPSTIRRQIKRGNLRAIYSPGGRVFYVTRKSFDAFKMKLDAMNETGEV